MVLELFSPECRKIIGSPLLRYMIGQKTLATFSPNQKSNHKACFSYVGKIQDDREFYFLPTIPDFTDISNIRQRSVPDFPDYLW